MTIRMRKQRSGPKLDEAGRLAVASIQQTGGRETARGANAQRQDPRTRKDVATDGVMGGGPEWDEGFIQHMKLRPTAGEK